MNPIAFLFNAAARMLGMGRSIRMDAPSNKPRHFGNSYRLSNDLYGRAPDGSIHLRNGKADSRADTDRKLGVVNRARQLCRLGRISRAELEARANRVGYTTIRPAQATA